MSTNTSWIQNVSRRTNETTIYNFRPALQNAPVPVGSRLPPPSAVHLCAARVFSESKHAGGVYPRWPAHVPKIGKSDRA
jgi:hypothetical protein